MADNGVLAVPFAGFADTITGLIARKVENSIIYVLLPDSPEPSFIDGLFITPHSSIKTCVVHLLTKTAMRPGEMDSLAYDVYDRLPRLVKRVRNRGQSIHDFSYIEDRSSPYLQYPRFTLAPNSPLKPALTLAWPLRSYDVLHKWRMIHVAYGYDPKRSMMVAFGIDSEGDGWEVRTWRDVQGITDEIWDFASTFATSSAIEWRLTISRLGVMATEEYSGRLPHMIYMSLTRHQHG